MLLRITPTQPTEAVVDPDNLLVQAKLRPLAVKGQPVQQVCQVQAIGDGGKVSAAVICFDANTGKFTARPVGEVAHRFDEVVDAAVHVHEGPVGTAYTPS